MAFPFFSSCFGIQLRNHEITVKSNERKRKRDEEIVSIIESGHI